MDSRDDTLGDCLTKGIQLRDMTTTFHAKTDVDVGELIRTDNENGLVHLVPKECATNPS